MKKDIHPQQHDVTIRCACGTDIPTVSTKQGMRSTLCSACHPFFTGAQGFVDSAGRIEKFNKKFGKK
jgi:large subunit ribosomal protein L31